MDELLFGVIGNPILQSQSPLLFQEFFRESGISGHYLRLAVRSAEEGIALAEHLSLSGINVTAPFKESMSKLLGLGEDGVNCVSFRGGGRKACSTDGAGVLGPLGNVAQKQALVIGAGGAARAAIQALLGAGASVSITNRTAERGEQLAHRYGIRFLSPTDESIAKMEILVNTVPGAVIPSHLYTSQQVALDALYHFETPFTHQARQSGVRVISGTEWLIFQGLAAFEFFTGKTVSRERIVLPSPRPKNSLIYLMGMMGSGKSTIGPRLAKELGYDFLELDSVIEERAGKTIAEIFAHEGEAHFRKIERAELSRTGEHQRTVVALGGGALVGNEALFPTDSLRVWLFSPVRELVSRVDNRGSRPLLTGASPEARLETLWQERRLLYARMSDLVLPTFGWNPDEVVRRICDEVRKTWEH